MAKKIQTAAKMGSYPNFRYEAAQCKVRRPMAALELLARAARAWVLAVGNGRLVDWATADPCVEGAGSHRLWCTAGSVPKVGACQAHSPRSLARQKQIIIHEIGGAGTMHQCGAKVVTTEGTNIQTARNVPNREGWSAAPLVPYPDEQED